MLVIEVKGGMVVAVLNVPDMRSDHYIVVDHDSRAVIRGVAPVTSKRFAKPKGYTEGVL